MTAAEEHRELLSAIADTLDLPAPVTYGDRYHDALRARVAHVRGVIEAVTGGPCDPRHATRALRRLAEEEPVTYPTREATS